MGISGNVDVELNLMVGILFIDLLLVLIKLRTKCSMFHIPLGDDGHGVSLLVFVPSCAGGGILNLSVAIVTLAIVR